MNKLSLIKKLSHQHGIHKAQSAKIVDLFFGQISDALAMGGRVEIRGLCTFKVKKYPGYTGRNPKSGEPVSVQPKKLPFFRAGTDLKDRVNQN